MADLPAWATERVEVSPADSRRQRSGSALANALGRTLGTWLVAPVEHVGSTAVPGLAAKPVIDLQAAVADLACAPAVAQTLAARGWHLGPEVDDGLPERLLVLVVDSARAAHLHLLVANSEQWDERPTFRDALRADAELARQYAELKQDLAVKLAHDREAYTTAKTAFVRSVLRSRPT